MLFDLFQIALQVGGQFVAFGSGAGVIQLVGQLPGNRGEVGDEVERVPDLVRDTGGQLTQRSHLLRLNKLFLGVPQFVQRMVEVLVRFFEFTVGLLLVAESLEQQKTRMRNKAEPVISMMRRNRSICRSLLRRSISDCFRVRSSWYCNSASWRVLSRLKRESRSV